MLPEYLASALLVMVSFFALTTTKGSTSGLTSRSLKMHKTGLFQISSDKTTNLKEASLRNYITVLQKILLQ
jgi:hypothetical protein